MSAERQPIRMIKDFLSPQQMRAAIKASQERADRIRSDPDHMARLLNRSIPNGQTISGDEFCKRYDLDPGFDVSAAAAPSPAPDAAEHGTDVDGGTGVAGVSALLSPPEERAQHAAAAGDPHPYTTDSYVHGAEPGPPCLVCGESRAAHYRITEQ